MVRQDFEDGGDVTGGQQVGALVPHQGGEPVGGAGGEQHPRRGVSAAGPGQPLRGGEAQLAGDSNTMSLRRST